MSGSCFRIADETISARSRILLSNWLCCAQHSISPLVEKKIADQLKPRMPRLKTFTW